MFGRIQEALCKTRLAGSHVLPILLQQHDLVTLCRRQDLPLKQPHRNLKETQTKEPDVVSQIITHAFARMQKVNIARARRLWFLRSFVRNSTWTKCLRQLSHPCRYTSALSWTCQIWRRRSGCDRRDEGSYWCNQWAASRHVCGCSWLTQACCKGEILDRRRSQTICRPPAFLAPSVVWVCHTAFLKEDLWATPDTPWDCHRTAEKRPGVVVWGVNGAAVLWQSH